MRNPYKNIVRDDQLDDRYFTSIDLSYDHVKEILNNVGFQMLEENTGVEMLL